MVNEASKSNNLFYEFQAHSTDFLRLLGEKSHKAEKSRQIAEELSVMEFFWDGIEIIFQKYEAELQRLRLTSATEHVKAVLLRNELKSAYNEMFKVRHKIPETLLHLMKTTVLPTEEDLKEDVDIRNKPTDGKKD